MALYAMDISCFCNKVLFNKSGSGGSSIKGRKKILVWGLMLIVTVTLIVSCGSGGGGTAGGGGNPSPSDINITHTVSGLNSNTIYYWKVKGNDGKGGITESDTYSFITQ